MMVTCPKCGFSQPKDRYCANCGIDMEAYRPADLPLTTRLMKSAIFQGAVVVLAVGCVFAFVQWEQKKSQLDSQAALTGAQSAQVQQRRLGQNEVAQSGSTAAAGPADELGFRSQEEVFLPNAAKNQQLNELHEDNEVSVQPLATTAGPSASPSATPSTEAQAGGTEIAKKINLVYAEVPRTTLSDLLSDARTLVIQGNYSTGTIPDLAKHLQEAGKARSMRTLDSQSDQTIHVNQPIVVFKGMRDPASGQNLGLTVQLTPVQNDDQGLHVLVEIQRNMRDGAASSATITEASFQQDFTIPKRAGAYITGLLPHRALDDNERQLYSSGGILKILASPSYQQGASEFVIFIEAR